MIDETYMREVRIKLLMTLDRCTRAEALAVVNETDRQHDQDALAETLRRATMDATDAEFDGPRPGDLMTWRYTPRGGYGYVIPVNAEVVTVNAKTVRIRVQHISGKLVERSVKPESLTPRKQAS